MTAPQEHYRQFFHAPAVFALQHGRSGATVVAGIAGAILAIAFLVLLLQLRPDIARREVDALGLLLVVAAFGVPILASIRMLRGPKLVVVIEGETLSLTTTSGRLLARCTVAEIESEPIVCRVQHYEHPAVQLQVPGYRRRLRLGVNYPADRLPWRDYAPIRGEATHTVLLSLWLPLLRRLGLAAELGQPSQPIQEAEPPTELSLPPPTKRYLRYLLYAAPMLIVVLAMAIPDGGGLEPECVAAARCCLARVNAKPPVSVEQLRGCTELAVADADRCPSYHSRAKKETEAAGLRCDDSVVGRYGSFAWSKPAAAIPDPADPPANIRKYPRVSCQDAAARLARATESGQSGELIVVRPRQLMTQAISLDDPNSFVYCEGYPLPVAKPVTGSSDAPLVEGPGPHAVLLRPLPDGRFEVRQYCLGCNRVGQEPRRR